MKKLILVMCAVILLAAFSGCDDSTIPSVEENVPKQENTNTQVSAVGTDVGDFNYILTYNLLANGLISEEVSSMDYDDDMDNCNYTSYAVTDSNGANNNGDNVYIEIVSNTETDYIVSVCFRVRLPREEAKNSQIFLDMLSSGLASMGVNLNSTDFSDTYGLFTSLESGEVFTVDGLSTAFCFYGDSLFYVKFNFDNLEIQSPILLEMSSKNSIEEDNNLSTEESTLTVETVSQANAVKKAKSYLDYMAFSYDGLIQQLEYEKFSHEDAVYGADNCNADWNQQAVIKAQSYLDYMAFSRDGLIEQLEYEKFSHEEAVYGADNCNADWNQQAAIKAQSYLDFMAFSRDGLIEQLEYEGFTAEQAAYGADAVGLY